MKNEDLDGVFKHVRKIRWSNIVHAFISSPTVNTQDKFSCPILNASQTSWWLVLEAIASPNWSIHAVTDRSTRPDSDYILQTGA